MKRKVLVTAIAMAVSGSAFAMDGGTNLTSAADGLYGNIRLALESKAELNVTSNKLIFGFKGHEDLGNGMIMSYGIELENDDADSEAEGAGLWTNDKSWVALAGGFGKLIMGEHSDMAGWACGATDILYIGTSDACSLTHNTSPADAIQYRGSAGDVNFGAAWTADGTTGSANTLIGLQYAAGDFSVGGQFASAGDGGAFSGIAADDSGSVIGGSYAIGGITLGLSIADNGSDTDSGATDFAVSLPVGPGSLAVVISSVDTADSDSTDILYSASIGKSGYAGIEHNSVDSDPDDTTTLFLGMKF